MNLVLKKVIKGRTIYRKTIYLKGLETIERNNQSQKKLFLGQFEKMTQAIIFEKFKNVVYWQQFNAKKDINKK